MTIPRDEAATDAAPKPVVIRKYANRRLYDSSRARCVTLADIAARLRAGERVRVVDARGGADVTRQVLAQILCEKEMAAAAGSILDEAVMSRLISLAGTVPPGRLSAALTRALDEVEAGGTHASGMLRRRIAPSERTMAARIDVLEARLKALMASADGAKRRGSDG